MYSAQAVLGVCCHVGFLLVADSGGYSLAWCAGFSLPWLLFLQSADSRHTGFNSWGSQVLQYRAQ